METITIKVNDFVSRNKGVTPDEGQPIYDKLMELFKEGNHAVLDFDGVEITTTAFLNVAVGNLYRTYTSEELKEVLSFAHVSDSTAFKIKEVTNNAKACYSDEARYDSSVNSVLNENS